MHDPATMASPTNTMSAPAASALAADEIHCGDCRRLLDRIASHAIALSVWSPPYFVGKSYERDLRFEDWQSLLRDVIAKHDRILKPGGFMAVNIADILCFPDPSLPRIQAENLGGNRVAVTREDVMGVLRANPDFDRYQIARLLGVSEQTVDRRMKHNNIRGGKSLPQTRVKLTGPILEEAAQDAGLTLYDRRVWVKDPCWVNSRWHTNSYRAVDEFEYVYVFWKPGITRIDRARLKKDEWAEWGSRGVWHIASVKANDDHEAKFPRELPRRIIRLLSERGDVVLDPFVGSGTTAVAAIEEGRHYIGIDSDARAVELARRACTCARRSAGP
jgi:site-specific DNA-methyltransferase (adenine-specific)